MDTSNYTRTGKYFYEPIEVAEHETTPEDEKFEMLAIESADNLCDSQSDGTCTGNTYYTDDAWMITHHCTKHWNDAVKRGYFVEVK